MPHSPYRAPGSPDMHREALHRRAETTEIRKHSLTDTAKALTTSASHVDNNNNRASAFPRVYVAAELAGSMKMGSESPKPLTEFSKPESPSRTGLNDVGVAFD
ncbi:hypothetical protein H112_07720 [Trichophyton rubrum D6]|uniref:Uncharacterized protein n=2 Tax=Trichophyton TaxID=5550 RepID=A0A022VQU5_TRIRU|nr:hypothetical protein H100_07744 [Trichophyton rubrum MR850]EZF37997.1 hypothetical protein H102_07709 [Trichophyton rubrum CBS 100081]EZF48632.1 hypothetical protein H103_07732 [Trichophyton rubrum CBS 288.86]EZF59318.1 hypothetical protein H104_07681 [Trichophyton rubrum CBS 289.86]EZF69886.1 hypothetical protein H105_07736 [Trichophyton soudanense CBS 452.61]EZF80509.1 hypothetical protein H110_07730 [Trichophyton rubrum MR1448]EZF91202.1 hypothetical protein H113_07791 [Trichophyton rub